MLVTHCFDLLWIDEGCAFVVFSRHLWSHYVYGPGKLHTNLYKLEAIEW